MSHPYLSPLILSFRGHKDPEAAPWMAALNKKEALKVIERKKKVLKDDAD